MNNNIHAILKQYTKFCRLYSAYYILYLIFLDSATVLVYRNCRYRSICAIVLCIHEPKSIQLFFCEGHVTILSFYRGKSYSAGGFFNKFLSYLRPFRKHFITVFLSVIWERNTAGKQHWCRHFIPIVIRNRSKALPIWRRCSIPKPSRK